MVADRARIARLRRRGGEEADRRGIEAVRVERVVLDPTGLLPEVVEELGGVGSGRRAAARRAGSLDRFRRDVGRARWRRRAHRRRRACLRRTCRSAPAPRRTSRRCRDSRSPHRRQDCWRRSARPRNRRSPGSGRRPPVPEPCRPWRSRPERSPSRAVAIGLVAVGNRDELALGAAELVGDRGDQRLAPADCPAARCGRSCPVVDACACRMLVPVGQMVIFFWIVRPLAIAIDSGVVDGPIMQAAPWSARLRAADSAACGSPCVSAPTSLAVMSTPALLGRLVRIVDRELDRLVLRRPGLGKGPGHLEKLADDEVDRIRTACDGIDKGEARRERCPEQFLMLHEIPPQPHRSTLPRAIGSVQTMQLRRSGTCETTVVKIRGA